MNLVKKKGNGYTPSGKGVYSLHACLWLHLLGRAVREERKLVRALFWMSASLENHVAMADLDWQSVKLQKLHAFSNQFLSITPCIHALSTFCCTCNSGCVQVFHVGSTHAMVCKLSRGLITLLPAASQCLNEEKL